MIPSGFGRPVVCAPQEFVPGSGDGIDGNYLTSAEITSATAKPHWFTGRNLVDQLEHEHLSWKAYMQSMPESDKTVECAPTNPATGGPIKLYAQEHNPDLSSRNRIFTTPTVPCRNYKRY